MEPNDYKWPAIAIGIAIVVVYFLSTLVLQFWTAPSDSSGIVKSTSKKQQSINKEKAKAKQMQLENQGDEIFASSKQSVAISLSVQNVSITATKKRLLCGSKQSNSILNDVSFDIPSQKLTALMGLSKYN